MQSNNSNSSQLNTSEQRIKNIIMMFFPLITAVILQYIVIIVDIIILTVKNSLSNEKGNSAQTVELILSRDYNQPMNMAYISLAQYIVYAMVFGVWFYMTFCRDLDFKDNLRSKLPLKAILCLIPAGYAAQLLVDGVLTLVRPVFTTAFAEYDDMVSRVTGINSSWVMLLSVILVAPIAEEILFRGLVLGYGKRAFPSIAAILLQGLLFGLYHGNMIQGVYAFILGTILGIIAHRLNSIIPGIILHISINAGLLFVPQGLFVNTTTTIITTIVSGIVFIILLFATLYKKNK